MGIVRKIFILLFFFFSFTSSAWSQTASEFISDLSTEASNILSSKLSEEEKIVQLKKIGQNSVDIDGVGFYTLGKHRKTLTEAQKNSTKNFLEIIF